MVRCVELVELLQLRPMSTLPENVQLHPWNLLESHQRAVDRVDPVLAAPDQQDALTQFVRVAPHHAELEVGTGERLAHGTRGGQRLGLAGDREALLDQFGRNELLVEDHDAQELLDVLARRLAGEPAEQLDALGRIRREQVDAQPAGTHQHQPARPVGVVQREPDRGAAAQRIAHQRSAFDAEMVEQVEQGGGAVAVVLLVLGVLVGVAVAGLVDGEHVELLGQHGDVAAEVRPARRPGPAAVQQHHRLRVADRLPRDSAAACPSRTCA